MSTTLRERVRAAIPRMQEMTDPILDEDVDYIIKVVREHYTPLAADLTEALDQIDKVPGIDVALKTIRHVRDVLAEQ